MTSFGSSTLDYDLDQRHLPRSQVERIPDAEFLSSDDESYAPSSLRANFLPPDLEYEELDECDMTKYGSLREGSLFSPVFASLAEIDSGMLLGAGEKEQKIRRKLLRGAQVLIVQGGYSGKRFVYQKLKDLGVKVYIMDGPDSCWRIAAKDGFIEDFLEIDFTENETVFSRAMEIICSVGVTFDGVTTYYEDAVPLAARIGAALGIEVNTVQACDNARNKQCTREVMKERGLPVPKFCRILKEEDISYACKVVGFPAILKPSYGAASIGVTKLEREEDAFKAYNYAKKLMTTDQDTIWAQGTDLLLEEFYDGDEFDIDVLLYDGEAVYAKVSDNWACNEPWFQETGTNCPSIYPREKQRELVQLAVDSTLALGFRYGAFHVECKYTSRGPRLIEVNARMGGVSVRDANLIAWGVDLVEEHIMAILKIPIRPAIPDKPIQYLAEVAINAPYSGTISNTEWLDFTREISSVRDVRYRNVEGDKVIGPEVGIPTFIAEIIAVSNISAEDAVSTIQVIVERKAKVPITADVPGTERPFFFPSHAHPFTCIRKT